MKRKILVVGSGGREHAICKKLLDSPTVETVYCAKGNPGMLSDGIKLVDIEETDGEALATFCMEHMIDLVFVGPEMPLLAGVVDTLTEKNIKAFGPSKKAAMIEGSKLFAKEIMKKYDIPTAKYESFTDRDLALLYIKNQKFPQVIKADGLASGKGVVIAHTLSEAIEAIDDNLLHNRFASETPRIVIEEYLVGKEVSLLSFVSEEGVYPMPAAKDHKNIFDGDLGPNTGGMGAYSPVPYVNDELYEEMVETIVRPTLLGMKQEGVPFTGILYTGLILTEEGPKVIEYNARFGDPETQVLLQRLDSDFAELLDGLVNNQKCLVRWKKTGYNLGVVLSAKGYPSEFESNKLVQIQKDDINHRVYYAGVSEDETKNLVSSGGRVLMVEAQGETLLEARDYIYKFLKQENNLDFYYRTDIGLN